MRRCNIKSCHRQAVCIVDDRQDEGNRKIQKSNMHKEQIKDRYLSPINKTIF